MHHTIQVLMKLAEALQMSFLFPLKSFRWVMRAKAIKVSSCVCGGMAIILKRCVIQFQSPPLDNASEAAKVKSNIAAYTTGP